MFILSAVFFVATYFVENRMLNIAFITLAVLASNGAATILWSIYCPSLKDTGVVSTATGYLDFLSYMAAAAASSIFSTVVTAHGWGPLVLVWAGIMVVAIFVAIPYERVFRRDRR